MTSEKRKTVRQWLETIPTINKVDTIQKYLDKEMSNDKPRQTIVKAFNERIELLTIKSKDVAVVKTEKVEETITHTPNIIKPTNTIENVLIPFKSQSLLRGYNEGLRSPESRRTTQNRYLRKGFDRKAESRP